MRALVYTRYSSNNQKHESIEAQTRAIKDYCLSNNIQIVKVYIDEAKSATSDNRPEFLKMIKEAPKLSVDCIIVHKLDRFARSRYDSAFYKKILKDNNIKLISVLENLDDSPEGIILESLIEAMAEYYSSNLAREVMKGMLETAYKCKHNGGTPPLGFDVTVDKKYSINEYEAGIIRDIFMLYDEGYGYRYIAEHLNKKGWKTKSKKLFSKTSIRDILTNEKYKGTYVFNRRADGKTLSNIKSEEEIIRVPGGMPAIISEELFDKINDRIKNRKRRPKMANKQIYLLTGKLFCGKCGSAYTGNGRVGTLNSQIVYSCTTRKNKKGCDNKNVVKSTIENAVIQELKDNALNEASINKIIPQVMGYITERNDFATYEVNAITKKVKENKQQIDKLFNLYLEDNIDKSILSNKINELKEELQLNESRLTELTLKESSWIDEGRVKHFLYSMKANLESNDPKLIKKVIDTFVDKIYVNGDELEITITVDELTDMSSGGEPLLTLSVKLQKRKRPQAITANDL